METSASKRSQALLEASGVLGRLPVAEAKAALEEKTKAVKLKNLMFVKGRNG